MLTLQVFKTKPVVHAQYRASTSGGLLVSVYPGGSFMGYSFDELVAMGTGEHAQVARNQHDFRNTGSAPTYKCSHEARLAAFEEVLFGYQVGAFTSLEVLAAARKFDVA